jgi:NTE family protein
MAYHFSNLVFECGGLKGIAYVSALEELDNRGILSNIRRVGGGSAGAIVAALVGVGYNPREILKLLWDMDFKSFMSSFGGTLHDLKQLKETFGWHGGDSLRRWMGGLIRHKTGSDNTTFSQLRKLADKKKEFKELHFMVSNLSTGFSEVMSEENSPNVCIADAVRLSLSIPLFFAAKRSMRGDVYVDGGVLGNHPIKLFDREKYLSTPAGGRSTEYYDAENKRFLEKHPESSPYVYNKETLGFRLNSKTANARFRDQSEPAHRKIHELFDFILAVIHSHAENQSNQHLHSDDWQRTIHVDTMGVSFTDFSIPKRLKEALLESGRKGVQEYFAWYDAESTQAANK